jgi:hypothetical protein
MAQGYHSGTARMGVIVRLRHRVSVGAIGIIAVSSLAAIAPHLQSSAATPISTSASSALACNPEYAINYEGDAQGYNCVPDSQNVLIYNTFGADPRFTTEVRSLTKTFKEEKYTVVPPFTDPSEGLTSDPGDATVDNFVHLASIPIAALFVFTHGGGGNRAGTDPSISLEFYPTDAQAKSVMDNHYLAPVSKGGEGWNASWLRINGESQIVESGLTCPNPLEKSGECPVHAIALTLAGIQHFFQQTHADIGLMYQSSCSSDLLHNSNGTDAFNAEDFFGYTAEPYCTNAVADVNKLMAKLAGPVTVQSPYGPYIDNRVTTTAFTTAGLSSLVNLRGNYVDPNFDTAAEHYGAIPLVLSPAVEIDLCYFSNIEYNYTLPGSSGYKPLMTILNGDGTGSCGVSFDAQMVGELSSPSTAKPSLFTLGLDCPAQISKGDAWLMELQGQGLFYSIKKNGLPNNAPGYSFSGTVTLTVNSKTARASPGNLAIDHLDGNGGGAASSTNGAAPNANTSFVKQDVCSGTQEPLG